MLEFPGEGVNLRKSAVFCENLRCGLVMSPHFCPLKRAQREGHQFSGNVQIILRGATMVSSFEALSVAQAVADWCAGQACDSGHLHKFSVATSADPRGQKLLFFG